jgi:hypothetical protein
VHDVSIRRRYDALSSPAFTVVTMRRVQREARFRLAWLSFDLRAGTAEGYPICCVVRFAVEHAWSPGRRFALERVGWFDGSRYVPCGVLHRWHRLEHPHNRAP